jgi:hypothetical protein
MKSAQPEKNENSKDSAAAPINGVVTRETR